MSQIHKLNDAIGKKIKGFARDDSLDDLMIVFEDGSFILLTAYDDGIYWNDQFELDGKFDSHLDALLKLGVITEEQRIDEQKRVESEAEERRRKVEIAERKRLAELKKKYESPSC